MKTLIGMIVALLLTVNVALSSAQEPLQDETLLMTFIPNIQFAPVYATIGAGYFEEAGFNVSLEYLNEPDVVELVAVGQHNFGVVSGEQVLLAVAQERPITYIYEWFQRYPVGVVYSADRDIESTEDLAGLRIGIPGRFGASYTGFTTLLEAADLEERDVQLEEIGFVAPEVFCVGAVEASVIYVNNEPLQIRNRAATGDCGEVEDVELLYVSDVVDLVSNGIITNHAQIETNPDTIRAFLRAYDAGLRLAIENPARAYLLSVPFVEGLPSGYEMTMLLEELAARQDTFLESNPDAEALYASHQAMYERLAQDFDADELLQFEVLLASIPLWNAERLGHSDLASWENMQETLLTLELLEEPVALDALFTNEFLPE